MKRKAKKKNVEVHLSKEVESLANQVVSAIKHSATSQEARSIGRDAFGGVRATGGRLLDLFRKVKEDAATHEIKDQAHRVIEISHKKTQGATKNLRRNLIQSLNSAGVELQRIAEDLKKKK